ncbi:MAG: type II toxin-antitoxin system HigB family toxin, partial [candidate division Zixibacteria bacterium]|nr:type II toxin-antitoxin system HigB family toxin [candidate division Zixibacteria bacterium]
MKVIGEKRLKEFCRKHADARSRIDAWRCEAEDAAWKSFHDIKARFNSASQLSGNRVVFNIRGNKYRLVVHVSYKMQIVQVLNA